VPGAWLTLATPPAAAGAATVAVLLAGLAAAWRTATRMVATPSDGSLEDMAWATADALHATGMTSHGGDAVRIEALADGSYRARLQDVPAGESAAFSEALEEVLSPLAQPRYVIPRLIVPPPTTMGAAAWLAVRRLTVGQVPATVVYHAVPAVLSTSRKLATAFERTWNIHVSRGQVLYTGSPEGAGILAVQRGDDPFAVTTQIRTLWR
jgi:hypothetical protein